MTRRLANLSARGFTPYVEIVCGLGLLLAINLAVFPQQAGWLEARPHPAWIVVVFVSARYGLAPGLTAGIAAAAFFVAFRIPLGLGDDLLLFVEPALFPMIGTLLGAVGETHLTKRRKLEDELAKLSEGLEDLGHSYLVSVETQKELQRRVISQTGTVTMLYDAAKRLETLDVSTLYPAILEAVQRFLGAHSCSLYLAAKGEQFIRKERFPEDNAGREVLSADEPIVQKALSSKDVVTVKDLAISLMPHEAKDYPIMMCAPVQGPEDAVVALITVERLPFLSLTSSASRMMRVIADWSGLAMKNAEWFQKTKDRNIDDDIIGAYNYGYITKRLSEEMLRARRYKTPLAVALCRIGRYDEIASDMVPKILRVVSFVFHRMMRKMDILGRYQGSDTFLMIFTNTGIGGALEATRRIVREIQSYGFMPYADDSPFEIGMGLAEFDDTISDAGDLLAIAQARLTVEDAAAYPAVPQSV